MPLPEKFNNVPPARVMSPTTKSVATSDKVNVIVAVSPAFRVVLLLEIEIVGGVVSLTAPGPTTAQFAVSAWFVLSKPKPPMSLTDFQSWINHSGVDIDVDCTPVARKPARAASPVKPSNVRSTATSMVLPLMRYQIPRWPPVPPSKTSWSYPSPLVPLLIFDAVAEVPPTSLLLSL